MGECFSTKIPIRTNPNKMDPANKSPNVTRDGVEVCIGQRWQDQDKRMRGRIITVRAVADGYAYFGPTLKRRIAIRRMHKHSTGFVLCSNTQSIIDACARNQH